MAESLHMPSLLLMLFVCGDVICDNSTLEVMPSTEMSMADGCLMSTADAGCFMPASTFSTISTITAHIGPQSSTTTPVRTTFPLSSLATSTQSPPSHTIYFTQTTPIPQTSMVTQTPVTLDGTLSLYTTDDTFPAPVTTSTLMPSTIFPSSIRSSPTLLTRIRHPSSSSSPMKGSLSSISQSVSRSSTDSVFTSIAETPHISDEKQKREKLPVMLIVITGIVMILLVAIIIAVVAACICHSYHSVRRKEKKKKERVMALTRLAMMHLHQRSNDPTPTHHGGSGRGYTTKQPQSFEELFMHIPELPSVEPCDLHAHVEALQKDDATDEYEDVIDIDVYHYNFTAELKCNKKKNRYADVLANEFTRVHLHTPAGHNRYSDYINANYIEGYSREKEYIATQGPVEKTAADFWSVVWSEKCQNIVMIANLMEDYKPKCFQYWPSGGVFLAHSFSISLQDEQILADYTIRTFTITLKDKRYESSGESRHVTQFHYTVWPDHGVPENCDSIVSFVRRVRSAALPTHGPIIIHCSAGVGRTGTFIAIDVMLQKLDYNEPLDVKNFVCRMRAQRSSMVQSSVQYMFIYEAVCHACLCGDGGDGGISGHSGDSTGGGSNGSDEENGEDGEVENKANEGSDHAASLLDTHEGNSGDGGAAVISASEEYLPMNIV